MQDQLTKVCTTCQIPKLLECFYNQRYGRYGKGSTCRDCASEQAKIRNADSGRKIARRISHLARTYGLTQEEYNRLLQDQNGVCAICGNSNISGHPLCVDHNKITGLNRDLLCHNCNRAIGLVGEDIEVLESMIKYLRKHRLIQLAVSNILVANEI